MKHSALAALLLVIGTGCAGSLDNVAPKMASALEQTKTFYVASEGIEKLVCTDPGKSAINVQLVQTGVVEPGALDKACEDAELGLAVGKQSINELVDIYNALNRTED